MQQLELTPSTKRAKLTHRQARKLRGAVRRLTGTTSADRVDDTTAAERLNAEGYRKADGSPLDREAVQRIRRQIRAIKRGRTPQRRQERPAPSEPQLRELPGLLGTGPILRSRPEGGLEEIPLPPLGATDGDGVIPRPMLHIPDELGHDLERADHFPGYDYGWGDYFFMSLGGAVVVAFVAWGGYFLLRALEHR